MTELALAVTTTDFDRTTDVTPVPDRPGAFTLNLDAGWSSLVGIHGGYLAAISVRGGAALSPGRPVRTLTTTFLRAGRVGSATLVVTAIREGRSMSTVGAEIVQEDRTLAVTRLTLMDPRTGPEWHQPSRDDLPPPDACVPIQPPPGVAHFGRATALIDPGGVPFTGGDRARVRGYLRPLEPRFIDAAWLAMAVDWFPPPAFVRVGPPTGGVSIDLTTHIHQPFRVLDPSEWLRASFELTTTTGGLGVEHGWIAAPDGTLLAESFHTRLTAQG